MRKLKIIEHISLDGVIQAPAARMKMATTHTADGRCPIAIPPREKWSSRRIASPSICCLAGAPTISGRASGRRPRAVRSRTT
jgi:hypothetical protein